ncbi:hypothetical protein [Streptomyces apocyni]|uniref:hypothetical protein n=1 Tax=Streptomyces apocyni TaxID=2654677 RepID=UPI0012EAE993|nr:hypothetical protein [Streptomyces apocyni]
MILQALGSILLGLGLAWLAARRLPDRLPSLPLVLATGATGALLGALVTHSALTTSPVATLVGALALSVTLLSLLLRPSRGLRRSRSATA